MPGRAIDVVVAYTGRGFNDSTKKQVVYDGLPIGNKFIPFRIGPAKNLFVVGGELQNRQDNSEHVLAIVTIP